MLQASPPKRKNDPAAIGDFKIIDLDVSSYDRLASRFELEQQESLSFLKSGIETRDDAFNALIEQLERVAIASQAPILLCGPTGAGKTQLAKRIFQLKQRRGQLNGSFVESTAPRCVVVRLCQLYLGT